MFTFINMLYLDVIIRQIAVSYDTKPVPVTVTFQLVILSKLLNSR